MCPQSNVLSKHFKIIRQNFSNKIFRQFLMLKKILYILYRQVFVMVVGDCKICLDEFNGLDVQSGLCQ